MTNNMLNLSLSGITGSGNIVGSTSPTMVTPALGVASATSYSFAGSGTLSSYLTATAITPTFTFVTPGDLSVAYTIQSGYYWRVGDIFLFSYAIAFTPTYTTASGLAKFNGLPTSFVDFNWCLPVLCVKAITFTGTELVATALGDFFYINAQGSATLAFPFTTNEFPSGVAYSFVISGLMGI